MLSTNNKASTTPVPENTPGPQNVGAQYEHPVWTWLRKQNLARSLTTITDKVKVRRPLSRFLREGEWKPRPAVSET